MLKVVADKYNEALRSLNDAERPLLAHLTDDVEEQLRPMLDPDTMSWNKPCSIEVLQVLLVRPARVCVRRLLHC